MQVPFIPDTFRPEFIPYQFTLSTFAVWAIDMLKRVKWFPWLTQETNRLNMLAGVIAAAATTAGIHFVLEANMWSGDYSVRVSGLTVLGMWYFAKGLGISLASQQTILKLYQATAALQAIAFKEQAKKMNGIS